jgi:ABC-2 type transport system ATP-binding protein
LARRGSIFSSTSSTSDERRFIFFKIKRSVNMENTLAFKVENLSKMYDGVTAIENVNLTISRGSVYGVLGRNGAGKTTLVECLVGLRKPDKGKITLFKKDGNETTFSDMKEHVGVQPQEMALFEYQTVEETFELFESFYRDSIPVDELLEKLKLTEIKNMQIRKLSGGQKQRVILGVALIGKPEILLLDEPTTGLDVQVRLLIWNIINEFKKEGKTVLMTTHYMEEVENLCDCISILHDHKIVATGTPKSIVQKYARNHNRSLDDAFINITGTELRLGVD